MKLENLGFHKADLAVLPTPLEAAPRFSRALGDKVHVFLKRDDATGLALGGNKARKLEFLVGEALALGSDTLITCGGPQSNHARMTAAAARKCGLNPVLVLDGNDPGTRQGNLLLDHLLGAELVFAGDRDSGAMMAKVAERLETAGKRPYIIPLGGSNALGALGYVACMEELVDQAAGHRISPDSLYVATGSCGTLAGLILGKILFNASFSVTGVAVSQSAPLKEERTVNLVMDAAALLTSRVLPTVREKRVSDEKYARPFERLFEIIPQVVKPLVKVVEDQVGQGYGIPTGAGLEAISLMARTEGVLIDPVYTGKALAGLIHDVRDGVYEAGETVVFLHTGGVPADFAYEEVLTERRKQE
jgi:1-aminocyclopropane-1-carboxylate deaminase/D-cysteine desulfhydrase-like pyridoxal-dependent ACC family enzyme